MNKKTYNLNVTTAPVRPRSKRQGTASAAGSWSASRATGTSAQSAETGGSVGDGHTHTNLADIGRLYFDGEDYLAARNADGDGERVKAGYADETTHAARADEAANAEEATHAQSAAELDAESPTRDDFLSAKHNDEAEGIITFLRGAQFGTFREGAEGGSVWQDAEGAWHFEADYVSVRRKFTAKEVEIQEVQHVGGRVMLTAANMTCDYVTELPGGAGWRCHFLAKDADGRAVDNLWKEGDQALCETFNLVRQADGRTGNRYYWRLVTGTGTLGEYHYIDLSAEDCAAGSDTPAAGDRIVQLGNRREASRQSAIVIAGAGEGSPAIDEYAGIDSYSLAGKLETRVKPGENQFTGRMTVQEGSAGIANFADLPEEVNKAVRVGAENLLRNTAFRGDLDSVEMDGATFVEAGTETYSPEFAHWDMSGSNGSRAVEIAEAASGRGVLVGGTVAQSVGLVAGEHYMFSLCAHNTGSGTATVEVSGGLGATVIAATGLRETFGFTATGTEAVVRLSGRGHRMFDIKLERGTVATDWCPATGDAGVEADRFRSLWYLGQALREGKTEILGGLVLSSLINLGKYRNGAMERVTAGMSGIYNDGDDVAFWGGGTLEEAVRAVTLFKRDPLYVPTEAELASIAKVVFTHGGRGILQDIVLRGYVYAEGGVFRGTVYAKDGEFSGTVNARNGVLSGFLLKEPFRITKDNVAGLGFEGISGGMASWKIPFETTGTYLIFEADWWKGLGHTPSGVTIALPSAASSSSREKLYDAMRYAGNVVTVVAETAQVPIRLTGRFATTMTAAGAGTELILTDGETNDKPGYVSMECRVYGRNVFWYHSNKQNLPD